MFKEHMMKNPGWFTSAMIALTFSGCASFNNPLLSSGPTPRVEDCALIQQATPAKYVCDGKTYTSVQLQQIRDGKPQANAAVPNVPERARS